jgi:tetrahydromethanopterin S-methyltransferase subunit H
LEVISLSGFRAEQAIVDIGGLRIGGRRGQLGTVIIPCLFNPRMKEVSDQRAGTFDKRKVKIHLERVRRISEKTGNPYMIDIMATTPEAIAKYIEFVSGELDELPFLFDAIDPVTRIAAAKYVKSAGLQSRAIWNSLSITSTEEEFKAVYENGILSVVAQAFDKRDPSPKGTLASLTSKGLLTRIRSCKAKNILVDVPVFDIASMGASVDAISMVRSELGLPVGCAPANATYQWREKRLDLLRSNFGSCHAAACAIMQFSGASYIMMGPIGGAPRIFKACAMTDAMIAYEARTKGVRPLSQKHPIYMIF